MRFPGIQSVPGSQRAPWPSLRGAAVLGPRSPFKCSAPSGVTLVAQSSPLSAGGPAHPYDELRASALETSFKLARRRGVGWTRLPEEFKYIVRIGETDIDGSLPAVYGLAKIKGIGYTTALAVLRKLGIDPHMRLGYLSDARIKELDEIVKDITKLNLPNWLYNRRKDYTTGKDMHLIGAELIFYARQDIEREKKIKSWRGVRHALGLKVRGQRTATTGRIGMTVGVSKKK